jgi:hypothetical protein
MNSTKASVVRLLSDFALFFVSLVLLAGCFPSDVDSDSASNSNDDLRASSDFEVSSAALSSIPYGYSTMTYLNKDGQSCKVHVYLTNPSSQGAGVAVYETGSKKHLSEMNLPYASPSKVLAKTNCGFMAGYGASGDSFYGLYYSNGELFKSGIRLSGVADSRLSTLDSDMQYYPSFCIRNDWTTAIRWPTRSQVPATVSACRTIVGAGHPLVYDGKNVFASKVYDNQSYLIFDTGNSSSKEDRFNTGIGWGHFVNMPRTFFGSRSDKSFLLVVVEGNGIDLRKGAELMLSLGSDNAVALDSNSASQMRVVNQGKVTSNGSDGAYYGTGIIAYSF